MSNIEWSMKACRRNFQKFRQKFETRFKIKMNFEHLAHAGKLNGLVLKGDMSTWPCGQVAERPKLSLIFYKYNKNIKNILYINNITVSSQFTRKYCCNNE